MSPWVARGRRRRAIIARAKVVVNASLYTSSRVFEIARVCYLLANAKAVVSDLRPDTIIEPDILGGIVAATPQDLVRQCLDLIEDESRRAALEARGRAIARARDIRDILRPVLATLDLSQG